MRFALKVASGIKNQVAPIWDKGSSWWVHYELSDKHWDANDNATEHEDKRGHQLSEVEGIERVRVQVLPLVQGCQWERITEEFGYDA